MSKRGLGDKDIFKRQVKEGAGLKDVKADKHKDVKKQNFYVRGDGVEIEKLTVCLPVDLAKRLRIKAVEKGVSLSELLRKLAQGL